MDWKRIIKFFSDPRFGHVRISLRARELSTARRMASHVFIDAIDAIPDRLELKPVCSKTSSVKNLAKELQRTVGGHKKDCEVFAVKLVAALKSALECKKPTAMSKRRELLWSRYAGLRAKKLPVLWKSFLQKIHCTEVESEPLVMELVNEILLENLISDIFPSDVEASPAETVILSKDEQNIIRYACGYVAFKLHQKFRKQHGTKAAKFISCLTCFYAEGPSSSLLNYTREWINRGGLFDVSDDAFRLFVAIETIMRNKLTDYLKGRADSSDGKSSIVEYVASNPDVQFYWMLI